MDTNDKKLVFKTAFKGFDKKGVVEYIRNLSAKFDEEIAAKQTEIDNIKSAKDELLKKVSSLEEKLLGFDDLNKALEEQTALVKKLAEEKTALEEELQVAFDKADNEYIPNKTKLEEENIKLKEELDAIKAETEKSKVEVADVLIRADKLAKKMYDDAVISANAQKAEIEKQIISKKSELLGINGEIERMKNVFQELYTKYVDKDI